MNEIDLSGIHPWYTQLGYRANPFQVDSLEPTDEGLRLLVGRDDELKELCKQILSADKVICVEGAWGVGKTSLVNAASHYLCKKYVEGKIFQRVIPCVQTFELTADTSVEEFAKKVYLHVIQALLNAIDNIDQKIALDTKKIETMRNWLNDPSVFTGVGATVLGVGVTGTKSLNQSPGFWNAGMEKTARGWLDEVFPRGQGGGIVCVIDNLEGLQSSVTARRLLDTLRDRLFSAHGLQWVICGANGIVNCAASTRVADYFSTPLHIPDLPESKMPLVLTTRLVEYAGPTAQSLPLTSSSFAFLYSTLNFNLRATLAMADEYCKLTTEQSPKFADEDAKAARFERWLRDRARTLHDQMERVLPQAAWAVLDVVMSDRFKGEFGLGNLSAIQSSIRRKIATKKTPNEETLRKHVNVLARQQLIVKQFDSDEVDLSTDDKESASPSTLSTYYRVTNRGALAHFHRLVTDKRETFEVANWLRTTAALAG